MSTFPASYSTLCPEALGELVFEKYGVDVLHCSLLVRGVGDTYLVESVKEKYILRVYRNTHRSLEQVQVETELLNRLREEKVSVSYPIKDLAGSYIQTVKAAEGERQIVLFSYAPGELVTIFTTAQLEEIGHEMARFHNVSSRFETGAVRWIFDQETTLFGPLRTVAPFFKNNQEDYQWLLDAAQKVSETLNSIDTSDFSTGHCHFDFLAKNFHFEGNQVTFFDFDFLGYGWLVNDVMTFWVNLRLDIVAGRLTEETADEAYQTFIAAYRSVRPLSNEELAVVPYLALGFWVFYLGFYPTHDQFLPQLQAPVLKQRIRLMKQALGSEL